MKLNIIAIFIIAISSIFVVSSCKPDSLTAAPEKKIKNACVGKDAKYAINPKETKFPKLMDECASASWGDEEKTTKCLKGHYPKLSDKCASCFGKVAACSKANCKAACVMNHFSDSCLKCVDKNCDAKNGDFNMSECTGLKEKQMPPDKPSK